MFTNGIVGIIVLLAAIFAIIKVAQSSEVTLVKALWIVLILVVPLIGSIVWFLLGPGDKRLKL